jgi:light-regulated signal transduction histidine kinase (bacteriophytochrome)
MSFKSVNQAEQALHIGSEQLCAQCETLRRLNAELKRANDDLSDFASIAAHDLREPLRTAALFCQMLQQRYKGQLDDDADQYLDFIAEGATRMELLISGLLEYAQTMGGRTDESIPVDSMTVLDNALCNLKAAIHQSGAVVTYGRLPMLAVRETHLLQLFQNIIGNAIKYRSLAQPHIQIWAEPDEQGWKIWVRDNGIGIDPKYAESIFERFRRLHSASASMGAGLGLATCHRIVERYLGRIGVCSAEGQGAAFYFTLPASAEKCQKAEYKVLKAQAGT